MTGIDPALASHKLSVSPMAKPVRQKVRRFHPDRHAIIQAEVSNLMQAGFIREVKYPEWLANVVVVPKKGGKWRVCVDYTDLNDACPKDSFPLPRIDQIVDASAGQGMLSFLDAFSGYHQIPMFPPDAEKTAFITPHGLFCYNVMSFGLKNAGATYQRLVTKIFRPLLGKTMEVYIDDMLVKSKERSRHASHLEETFELLRKHCMKLNPLKCAFGVSAGKFLGFMVTQRGIEANPSQIKAILESQAPDSRKSVQQLTGRLAALGRFISRSTDRLKPMFDTLKGGRHTGWNADCDRAFDAIKTYLSKPPTLTSSVNGETLYIYLSVSETAVSAALFKEDEDKKQKPVFYVSKSLLEAETRYSRLEQMALALRMAAKKLRPYFQAHPITVLTSQPLRSTLHKPDLSGRMARWAIELSEFDIQYKPRLAKKGQVLADFLAELPRPIQNPDALGWWILNVDGASRQTGAGVGVRLKAPTGEEIEQAIRLGFSASNNESEYEATLAGLSLAAAVSADRLLIQSDSQLVVGHTNEDFESRDPRMTKYTALVKRRLRSFIAWKMEHIPRGQNERADMLAGVAASFPTDEDTYLPIYFQRESSLAIDQIHQVRETSVSWADSIIRYLESGELPEEKIQAHRTQVQASRFSLIDGQLYKRSINGPYLKCLSEEQGQYILAELHEGVCGNHPGGRTLAHRAYTQGYYWPTMRADAAAYVKRCDSCQRNAPVSKAPAHELTSITSPWPFAQWGIDIVGPFPIAPAQKKLLLVATDYFSKWIEAEAFASIKDKDVVRFLWKSIVCRYGIPRSIVSDNGPQFDSRVYRDFCEGLNIKNLYSTPRYPQSNGQAEASNKTILTALKKRLDSAKGKWVDELPGVLWAYRTTSRRPTGISPFALTYGMEAVIPTEIGMPTLRTDTPEQSNNEAVAENLDMADELREAASIRMASYQKRLANWYNKRTKPRTFQPGDFVLRKVFENTADPTAGKLQSNWEGPYVVVRAGSAGSYALDKLDGTPIPRMWNALHLKRYYQ